MDRDIIEIRYKRWLRIACYILCPILLVMSIYMFQAFVFGTESNELPALFNIFMSLVSGLSILGCLLGIPVMNRLKIIIDSTGITREGLFTKKIAYDEISRIKVGKGALEIKGGGLFDAIIMGDLYQEFDDAVKVLASNVADSSDITFKGKEKYIKQYFGRE